MVKLRVQHFSFNLLITLIISVDQNFTQQFTGEQENFTSSSDSKQFLKRDPSIKSGITRHTYRDPVLDTLVPALNEKEKGDTQGMREQYNSKQNTNSSSMNLHETIAQASRKSNQIHLDKPNLSDINWPTINIGNIFDIGWDPKPPQQTDAQKDLVQPEETHLEGVPSFIEHPKPLYYTMKGHPATIECVAEPVSHAAIKCADQTIPYKGPGESGRLQITQLNANNEPDQNGKRWVLRLQVRARDVEEWFDSYVCHCEAWNKVLELQRPKKVISKITVVKEAFTECRQSDSTMHND